VVTHGRVINKKQAQPSNLVSMYVIIGGIFLYLSSSEPIAFYEANKVFFIQKLL